MSEFERSPFTRDDADGYIRIGAFKAERFANGESVHPDPGFNSSPDRFSLTQRRHDTAPMLGGIIPVEDMPPLVTIVPVELAAYEAEF